MHVIIDIVTGIGVGWAALRMLRSKGYVRVTPPAEPAPVRTMRDQARVVEIGSNAPAARTKRVSERKTAPAPVPTSIASPYLLGDGGEGDAATRSMMGAMEGPGLLTPRSRTR